MWSNKTLRNNIKLPSENAQQNYHKPIITAYHIENELKEIPTSELDPTNLEINVILELQIP